MASEVDAMTERSLSSGAVESMGVDARVTPGPEDDVDLDSVPVLDAVIQAPVPPSTRGSRSKRLTVKFREALAALNAETN